MTMLYPTKTKEGEVLIAVIGVTGAGKTSFVSRASGRDDLSIGHGVDSCTREVQSISFQMDGTRVTLIDTPGFDDTYLSDTDILRLVAEYLVTKFHEGIVLNGVVLLQPISQNRLQGSEMKRTRLFKKILGEDAYKRVIIATTMWNQIFDGAIGLDRVEERKSRTDVWGDMVSKGAEVVRHNDNQESALKIIRKLMRLPETAELLFQQELASNGYSISRTSAGRQLDEDLGEQIAKMKEEIEDLKKECDATREEAEELRRKLEKKEEERKENNRNTGWKCTIL